jgi:hypothetical protein
MDMDERGVVAMVVATALLTVLAYRAVARRWRSWRGRRRMRRAAEGEVRAATLLRRRGFEVEGAQVAGSFVLCVDDAPHTVRLRADLIVQRRGRRYVAEVKTGAVAPRPDHRATRRQLLEYGMAYYADGVLLVDAEREAVHEVRFPGLTSRRSRRWGPALWALAVGAVAGAAATAWLGRAFPT